MVQQANKHRRPLNLRVGDLVYLRSDALQIPSFFSRKLAAKYIGPFPVVKTIGATSYRLQLPPRYSNVHPVFHASQLRPHFGDITEEDRQPTFTSNNSTEYEVEAIINHRFNRRPRRLEYLIRWRNFDASEDTWEPESHLDNCRELL